MFKHFLMKRFYFSTVRGQIDFLKLYVQVSYILYDFILQQKRGHLNICYKKGALGT